MRFERITGNRRLVVVVMLAMLGAALAGGSMGCPAADEDPAAGGGGGSPGAAFDPEYPHGLWVGKKGEYLYIWPSGHFVTGRPFRDEKGVFDESLNLRRFDPELKGVVEFFPDPRAAHGKRVVERHESGGVAETVLRFDGHVWEMRWQRFSPSSRGSGGYVEDLVRPASEASASSLSGRFARSHAGGFTRIEFKPGNRVHIEISGDVVTGTSVDGEGSYTINGWFMRVVFDSHEVLEDLFQVIDDTVVLGNTHADKQ